VRRGAENAQRFLSQKYELLTIWIAMALEIENQLRAAAKTRNFVHSLVLVGGIGAVMVLCTWVLFGQSGVVWAFVLIGVLLLLSPRIAPELIMRMYGARRVPPRPDEPLARIVAELARRAELPATPSVYVIPSPVINGFATGTKSDAIIAVTQGMLSKLDPRELIGVLAHEISHVRNNDLWIMSLADTMSRFTHFMSMFGVLLFLFSLPLAFFGGQPIPWLGILLLYFAPTLSSLLQLGLSRAREYDADLEGASLSGDPQALASALHKIEAYQGTILETIFLPGRRVPVPSLLRTHPPTEERIKRLLELHGERRPPVEVPGAESLAGRFVAPQAAPRYHLTGVWY
jgi:heat shock protein HtpX